MYPPINSRWLILQSDGAHRHVHSASQAPNWFLRECRAWRHALRQCGIGADLSGPRHGDPSQSAPRNLLDYSVILLAEQYEVATFLPQLQELQNLRWREAGSTRPHILTWVVDSHYQTLEAYRPLCQVADVLLHANREAIAPYRAAFPKKVRHLWFPNATDARYFNTRVYAPAVKTQDVSYYGSLGGRRVEFMTKFTDCCRSPNSIKFSVHFATGMDYIHGIRSSRIHLNLPIGDHMRDLNYRNFETIGLGTCLLTEYHPDLETLGFEHLTNCLFYRDVHEAYQLADMALATGLWEPIGAAGAQLAETNTYTARVSRLLQLLKMI